MRCDGGRGGGLEPLLIALARLCPNQTRLAPRGSRHVTDGDKGFATGRPGYTTRPPLTRYAMPNPASADAIPMMSIRVPLRRGRPIVVFAFHQPIPNKASALPVSETTPPRRMFVPITMNGMSGTREPRMAAIPTRIALFRACLGSTGARYSSWAIMISRQAFGFE